MASTAGGAGFTSRQSLGTAGAAPGETRTGEPTVRGGEAAGWEFGPFRLLACGTLLGGDRVVPLAPKEEGVLRLLVAADGRRLTKDEILVAVWPGESVSDSSLTRAMHTLRRRLAEVSGGGSCIRTVYGRGYQLAVPVRRLR